MFAAHLLQTARIVRPLQSIDHGIQAGVHQISEMLAPLLRGFHNNLYVITIEERFAHVGSSAVVVLDIGTNLPPFSDTAHSSAQSLALFPRCGALDET